MCVCFAHPKKKISVFLTRKWLFIQVGLGHLQTGGPGIQIGLPYITLSHYLATTNSIHLGLDSASTNYFSSV